MRDITDFADHGGRRFAGLVPAGSSEKGVDEYNAPACCPQPPAKLATTAEAEAASTGCQLSTAYPNVGAI